MKNIIFYPVILLLLCFIAYMALYHGYQNSVQNFNTQKVTLSGIIDDRIDKRLENSYATMSTIKIKVNNYEIKIPKNERIRFKIPLTKNITRGDFIELNGTIETIQPFETSYGKTFNYTGFMKAQHIYASVQNPTIVKVAPRFVVFELFDQLFFWSQKVINKFISFPASALVSGVLLGDKSGFDKATNNEIQIAGITHVVVLSGYNVTLVVTLVLLVTARLNKKLRILCVYFFLFLFLILVGPTQSLLRASVMTSIILLVDYYGFDKDYLRALLLALIIIAALNPPALVWDISLHLSFLATIGLLVINPHIAKLLFFIPNKFSLQEIITTTLSTQIAVLPVLIFQIGAISTLSPLVNLLVVPLVPPLMILGFIILITSWIPIIPYLVGFCAFAISSLIFLIVHFVAGLPFAQIIF